MMISLDRLTGGGIKLVGGGVELTEKIPVTSTYMQYYTYTVHEHRPDPDFQWETSFFF